MAAEAAIPLQSRSSLMFIRFMWHSPSIVSLSSPKITVGLVSIENNDDKAVLW
jgi:hypothetical protein